MDPRRTGREVVASRGSDGSTYGVARVTYDDGSTHDTMFSNDGTGGAGDRTSWDTRGGATTNAHGKDQSTGRIRSGW